MVPPPGSDQSCLNIDPATQKFPALVMCTPDAMMNGQPDKAFARINCSHIGLSVPS